MYKRILPLAIAIALTMALTGCVSNDYDITVHEDGSTTAVVTMLVADEFSKQVGMDMESLIAEANTQEFQGIEIVPHTATIGDQPYSGISYTGKFTTTDVLLDFLNNTTNAKSTLGAVVDDVPDSFPVPAGALESQEIVPPADITEDITNPSTPNPFKTFDVLVDKSLFTTTYTVSGEISDIWTEDNAAAEKNSLYDLNTIVKSGITIKVPGKITQSSDPSLNGGNVLSVAPVSLTEPLNFSVTSSILNIKVIIAVVLAGVALVTIVILVLFKRKKSKPNEVVQPAEEFLE